MSRRDAAVLLGFGSEFKVRQLEKQGRLRPVRGPMGSAWYPRADVLALGAAPPRPTWNSGGDLRGLPSPSQSVRRWSDAALIAHLRRPTLPDGEAIPRARTVVDLVADTGVSIARAERVYRFWLAHDHHPVAETVRAARKRVPGTPDRVSDSVAPTIGPEAIESSVFDAAPGERRGVKRLERDSLIRALRHPDPATRASAFERLKR